MSKNRTQYIWKYSATFKKKQLVFNSLSFLINNFIDYLAHGEGSSVHHINRYRFQCSLNSCQKGSKIFSGYLLIQSILTEPLLNNMKDIFDRVQIWTSCWNGKFSSANLIPGRSDFRNVLWRITILWEKFPPWVSTFFKYAGKMFTGTTDENF